MGNIIYLTCIERIFFGVLRSQVIKTLMTIKETSPNLNITLVSFVKIHHYIKYFDRKKQLKIELSSLGIRFIQIPIIYLSGYTYIYLWLLPLFLVQTIPIMLIITFFTRAKIIHSRSYPASLVGLFIKKLLGVKLIFDMRGIYVDEGLLQNVFKPKSKDEKLWRNLETQLIQNADVVIGVSPSFKTFFRGRLDDGKFFVVPCSVDQTEFYFDESESLTKRKELNLLNRFIIVFSGSLGTWLSIESIISIFKRIKAIKENAFLLILTQTINPAIKKALLQLGSDEMAVYNLNPEQVAEMLRIADMALLLRKKNIVNKVAFAVKFGEYLASGVPVVVTKSAYEIARLVKKYRCGVVIEDENDINLENKIKELIKNTKIYRANGFQLVNEYLSLQQCTNKYLRIYKKLIY